MDIYTFNRVEKKYILNEEQYNRVLSRIQEYFHRDEKGCTRIFNIYFDNDSYELINTSIQKPVFKEKLRLRSYCEANDDTKVFLEIKKKYKKIVYKRRIHSTYKQIKAFLQTGELCDNKNIDTAREIEYVIRHYNLKPRIHISYQRQAYFCNTDEGLRITFDHDIKSRYNNLTLSQSEEDEDLLNSDVYIMEIKTQNAIPLFLCRILTQEKIYPSSFSKVGNIHKKKITGGNNICFKAYLQQKT